MVMRILKWVGIVVGVLLAFIVVTLIGMTVVSTNRINSTYEVTANFSVDVPDDTESIAAGKRFYEINCESCHTESLAGELFSDDWIFGRMYTANLTSGEGGIASQYSNDEIAQVIWYGVKPDGSPTVGMPFEWFEGIHTQDMGNLIAYIRSVAPVDTDYPAPQYGPMLHVFHTLKLFPLVAAEYVDMDASPPEAVSPDDTLALGEYTAVLCTACHGANFTGLDLFGSPNITPHETAIGTWTEEEFVHAITEGIRPDGTGLDPEQMPWESFSLYTDEEIHAIWEYLQTVEAIPSSS